MSSRVPTTNPSGRFPEDSFKYSPLEHVRTLFVRFIQGLFYVAPPGAYHWEPNETSELYVTDENPIKTEDAGTRPSIAVTRGPAQFYSLGFDDMLDYNFQTGKKQKGVIVPGTMIVNCCSRVEIECERLAWIIGEQLWANREILLRLGFFEVGRQPSFGAPSPAGSIVSGDNADEWYVVALTCPFQFTRTTNVTPIGPRILQGIDLAMRASLQRAQGLGPVDGAGAEYPTFAQGCPPSPFAPASSDVNGGTPTPGSPPPERRVVPHPLNPSQMVTYRSIRPNSPAVKPPSIGGRSIPLSTATVEESCGKQMDTHVTDTSTVKV
jgi:hypothetical protein